MIRLIATLAVVIVVLASPFAPTQAFGQSKKPNGEVCTSASDCISNQCYNGPGDGNPKYCISREMHCALPGYDGAKYGSVIMQAGTLFCCLNPGGGGQARLAVHREGDSCRQR